jgi:hypothetical protein
MSDGARVLSIDALAELRDTLHRFAEKAARALEGAHNEVNRAVTDIEQKQQYWLGEIRRREEEVARAKSELATRKWGHRGGGGPGTTDQEIALTRARNRLREAEEKLQVTRRWLRSLPQDISEFEGRAGGLVNFLEHDLKRAVVLLQNKIDALEAYTRVAAPDGGTPG